MKQTILLALFAGCLWAEGGATTPPPPDTLPTDWYGGFVSYNTSSSPKVGGGGVEASLLSKSAQLYSFSAWDVTLIRQGGKWSYQSTPRTGLAMIIKSFGPIYIIGTGNMGVATAGANASLASSAGGIVLVKLGTTQWTLFGGYHILHTGALGGTQTVPELGIGRTF